MPNVARALTTLIAALVAMLGLGASTDAVGTPAPATAVAYVYDAPAFPTIPASSRVDRGPPTKAYDYASMLAVDPSPNISTHPKGAGNSAFTAYDVTAKVARVNEGTGTTRGKAQAIDGDFNGLESAGVAAKSGDDMVDVWRAVGPDEAADIAGVNAYKAGPGQIGKYFYPTRGQAENLAGNYTKRGIGAPYTLTSGKVPRSVLDGVDSIHPAGEGPAWFFQNSQLPSICRVTCHGPVG